MTAQPTWATPPLWNNQEITLYHGTLAQSAQAILQNGVSLAYARTRSDFGLGFYTTTLRRQAEVWAYRRVDEARRKKPSARPGVIEFMVSRDRLAELDCLWFVRGDFDADDFWSFVFHCRIMRGSHGRTAPKSWYDIAVGPVVASLRQRAVIQGYDQVGFHTDDAIGVLNSAQRRRVV
jgi:hypothetical protein